MFDVGISNYIHISFQSITLLMLFRLFLFNAKIIWGRVISIRRSQLKWTLTFSAIFPYTCPNDDSFRLCIVTHT